MKKIIFTLIFISLVNISYSQGLVVHTKSGNSTTFSIALIDSITFSLIPQDIIFFDDFESDSLSDYLVPSGHTLPELTDIASFSPTHSVSLKYPRNSYSTIGKTLNTSINSDIIGYNCKMMKNNLADKSNMMIFLLTGDVNSFGAPQQINFGLYQDSILCIVENNSNPNENVSQFVEVIQENRWYDFTIEYNFSTSKAAFFIDGAKVFESSYTAASVQHFYFGDWSSGGSPMFDKVLFIDDIKVYKR